MDRLRTPHYTSIDPRALAALTADGPRAGACAAPLAGYGASPGARLGAYPPPAGPGAPGPALAPGRELGGDWGPLTPAALVALERDYARAGPGDGGACFPDATDARALRLGRGAARRHLAAAPRGAPRGPASATALRRKTAAGVAGLTEGGIQASPLVDNQEAFARRVRHARRTFQGIPTTYGRPGRDFRASRGGSSAS